ncbi:MAG TPA: hypothetical protein DCP63_09515, partial [Bacteroidetes bacterium]|nr:hypothetical protein [Bacteroidota bacterium]
MSRLNSPRSPVRQLLLQSRASVASSSRFFTPFIFAARKQACSHLVVLVLIFVLAGCERRTEGLVDATGDAPFVSNAVLSPSIIDTDTIRLGQTKSPDDLIELASAISVKVAHRAGLSRVSEVQFLVRDHSGSTSIASGTLGDDGAIPDQVRGDGIFSARASFKIKRVTQGTFTIEVSALSTEGYRSNGIILPLYVLRSNQPPILSSLQAPDTVRLANQDQLIQLRVRADDPNGREDLLRVIFNSFL